MLHEPLGFVSEAFKASELLWPAVHEETFGAARVSRSIPDSRAQSVQVPLTKDGPKLPLKGAVREVEAVGIGVCKRWRRRLVR